jgi:lysyl-tRNA synthetase class 2
MFQGVEIDMGHWERLTMAEAVKKYAGVDYNDWTSDAEAREVAKKLHVEVADDATKGRVLIEIFDAYVEEKLIQPTFIYDYPVENSPLAKRKPTNPAFTPVCSTATPVAKPLASYASATPSTSPS